ncbi:hypothetical protein FB45DRAFT_927578 [Roridomyces roridus]|uniref:F-box domain-containing protein n=1 Tax=Roridomyces roridus TaxID=1738132 RepID=A0AAD7BIS2_9AGAR|nr:hypothetical protein FB45DRAFT_927578 [Roridomyces roridus]
MPLVAPDIGLRNLCVSVFVSSYAFSEFISPRGHRGLLSIWRAHVYLFSPRYLHRRAGRSRRSAFSGISNHIECQHFFCLRPLSLQLPAEATHQLGFPMLKESHQGHPQPRIRLLPPELFAEIFAFAVDSTFHFGDISEVRGPISHQAPWVFTRVCRRWAEIALATPSLWAKVFLDLECLGERGALQLTKLLHERSRDMPLTVKIFSEQSSRSSHHILDAVALAHVERWQNVDLYVKLPLFLTLAAVRGRLSSLTTLTMSLDVALEDVGSVVDPEFWNIFAVAPKLTALCASFWADDELRRSPFVFPWHQLTRLSTTFATDVEALSVLQQLSSIVDCRMEYVRSDGGPHPPIHLPHLRSLLLQIDMEAVLERPPPPKRPGKHPTPSILDSLETPILECLTTHQTASPAAVLALVARSGCAASLRSLHIHTTPLRPDTVLALLHNLPALNELEFGDLNGALLPRSPTLIPGFVRALAADWAATRGVRRGLTVRIVDGMYHLDIEELLVSLERDGLFVSVSANTRFQSLVADNFL